MSIVNDNTSSALAVQTVNQDGKAPKRRLQTASAALTSYYQARSYERLRDVRFGAIAGIFAGFPPIPPSEMQRQGAGDMPNVNLKQFQAKIGQYVSSWRAINAGGKYWFTVKMEHDDPMEAKRRSDKVTEIFNYCIKRWGRTDRVVADNSYVLQSAVRDTQMGLFSLGVSHFDDPIDWRWQVRPTRKCLVPEGTRVWLDNCQCLFIEDQTSVTKFWAKRKKPGWNEAVVLALLYNRANQNYPGINGVLTYAEWVQRVRENDTWLRNDFSPLQFVHSYVREFTDEGEPGRITHGIFCDTTPVKQGPPQFKPDADPNDWVYIDPPGYEVEHWGNVISVFCDDPGGEGTWHGAKGFGDLIYDQCHANDIMWNKAAMAATVGSTPVFKGGNESDRQKLNQVVLSPFGILIDLEVQQFKIAADVEAPLAIFDSGTRVMNQNSRSFPQNDQTSTEQPTATQIRWDRADQASFTDLQISNYRTTGGDPLGSEMYRRIAQPASKYPDSWAGGKAAKYFRDACAEVGIPENELLDVECVEMNRNVGTGNMAADLFKAQQALTVATPGDGQIAARELTVSALYGPDMVAALVQREQPKAGFEDVVIDLENLALQDGQTPVAFGFQPHEQHLGAPQTGQGHLAILAQIENVANQMMDQGIGPNFIEDAAELHRKIDAAIAHCGQHVEFMAQMPRSQGKPGLFEQQVKELTKLLHNMQQFSDAFGKAIMSAQERAQPQAAQMSPEMAIAQAEIQIMWAKANAEIAIKKAESEAKMGNMVVTHQARTEMKTAEQELQLGGKAKEMELNLANQRASHKQELVEKGISAALDVQTAGIQHAQDLTHEEQVHNQEMGQNAVAHAQELQQSQEAAAAAQPAETE